MFCGGCHIIQKVDGRRIANDKNKYLIAMWKGLQESRERPKIISKELYSKARTEYNNGTNIEFDDFMIGWIGWEGGFAIKRPTSSTTVITVRWSEECMVLSWE